MYAEMLVEICPAATAEGLLEKFASGRTAQPEGVFSFAELGYREAV
jgi:hypothetical protein